VWDEAALRDPHGQPDKAQRVAAMFDAIACTYEAVNTVASLGRDAAWRRLAVAAADVRPGDVVLDICCGTGDMLRAFGRAHPGITRLIGVDFATGMLRRAKCPPKPHADLLRADALRLPLADASVDVISCAFGVRNFGHLQAGLDEMARVAKPGARVVILEFAMPDHPPWRWACRWYCQVILPRLGAWVSGERCGAYRYLARSIAMFPKASELAELLRAAGFVRVTLRRLNFGVVVLYRALRP